MTLRIVKPTTREVTPELAKSWKKPGFQREVKINRKVEEVCDEIKQTEVIPGMFLIGVVDGVQYLVDGQHRREAFYMSGVKEAFLDVRYLYYDTMAELAEEYRKSNQHLVNMTPDDILKSMEEGNEQLRRLRKACPYIGYANIRRGPSTPVVSMSCVLRCWFGSAPEVPSIGGMSAADVANNMSSEEVTNLIAFMEVAIKAWGRDPQVHRLWGNLNMAICMWLYRKMVIGQYSAATKKIGHELFMKCLMSLSADDEFCSWLVGRSLTQIQRSPTYQRIKAHFAKRIEMETGTKPRLPSPAWGGR